MDLSIPTDILCCRCLQPKCRCVNFPSVFFPPFFRDIETQRRWEVSCSRSTREEQFLLSQHHLAAIVGLHDTLSGSSRGTTQRISQMAEVSAPPQ